MEFLLQSLRIVAILSPHNFSHTHIQRESKNAASAGPCAGVSVSHQHASCGAKFLTEFKSLVQIANDTLFQSHHQIDGFEHRARFVAEHGVVHALFVVAFFIVVVKVGNGFDFAGAHFHQNGASPFGFCFVEFFEQFGFHNFLQCDIDGGGHIVAWQRLGAIVGGIDIECHLRSPYRHAKEQTVERFFQSRRPMLTAHIFHLLIHKHRFESFEKRKFFDAEQRVFNHRLGNQSKRVAFFFAAFR